MGCGLVAHGLAHDDMGGGLVGGGLDAVGVHAHGALGGALGRGGPPLLLLRVGQHAVVVTHVRHRLRKMQPRQPHTHPLHFLNLPYSFTPGSPTP